MRRALARQKQETATPTTKTCPHCLNTVPLLAGRCGFCTSDIKDTVPAATPAVGAPP